MIKRFFSSLFNPPGSFNLIINFSYHYQAEISLETVHVSVYNRNYFIYKWRQRDATSMYVIKKLSQSLRLKKYT